MLKFIKGLARLLIALLLGFVSVLGIIIGFMVVSYVILATAHWFATTSYDGQALFIWAVFAFFVGLFSISYYADPPPWVRRLLRIKKGH